MRPRFVVAGIFVIAVAMTVSTYLSGKQDQEWEASLTEDRRIQIAQFKNILAKEPVGSMIEWRDGGLTLVRPSPRDVKGVSAGIRVDGPFSREFLIRLDSRRQIDGIVRIYLTTDPDYLNKLSHFAARP